MIGMQGYLEEYLNDAGLDQALHEWFDEGMYSAQAVVLRNACTLYRPDFILNWYFSKAWV